MRVGWDCAGGRNGAGGTVRVGEGGTVRVGVGTVQGGGRCRWGGQTVQGADVAPFLKYLCGFLSV